MTQQWLAGCAMRPHLLHDPASHPAHHSVLFIFFHKTRTSSQRALMAVNIEYRPVGEMNLTTHQMQVNRPTNQV